MRFSSVAAVAMLALSGCANAPANGQASSNLGDAPPDQGGRSWKAECYLTYFNQSSAAFVGYLSQDGGAGYPQMNQSIGNPGLPYSGFIETMARLAPSTDSYSNTDGWFTLTLLDSSNNKLGYAQAEVVLPLPADVDQREGGTYVLAVPPFDYNGSTYDHLELACNCNAVP